VVAKSVYVALALIGSAMIATPVEAVCFDTVGCSNTKRFNSRDLRRLKCSQLWYLRNAILNDHDYCFKTERGATTFDNSGCLFHDIADLPFSSFERFNLDAIRKMERLKRC